MSLFAAYADETQRCNKTDGNVQEISSEWLKNSSFNVDLTALNAVSTSKENETCVADKTTHYESKKISRKKEKKRRKKRAKETEAKLETASQIWDEFKIDVQRNNEFLTIKTISYPSAPRYTVHSYIIDRAKRFRKRKFKRYFNIILKGGDENSNSENGATITKKDLAAEIKKNENEHFTGFKQEEDMSKRTAHYNRSLAEDPKDIEMWLKYVQFQDSVFQFEKTFRKGSIAKGLRVTAERKLAIVDKALTHNPNCEILLRERLNIAVGVYPADELQVQIKKLVEKEQGNIILWQGYIEATQCSMSHCNTPAVLNLYNKCLSTLHKLRRNSTLEKSLLEENILRMLYQCGLFLKQAGLFEQLWTLLRLYLELNLSPTDKNKFNIGSGFDEKQLVELEDVILNSQLPLHELWLRIEKLRESCHWLPYSGEAICEDPQRLVFPDDVAELIHPITMPENIFKLTSTILTLLKVPLLPCRHMTMQDLGLDYVPWALDSIESLLPAFFNIYPIDLRNKYLLSDTQKLAVGPQYLKTLPGQEEYLEFLIKTMRNCIDCLNGNDRLAIIVWWFRFQRLLVVLDTENRFKMSQTFKKKMKSSVKNLLKEEENRNNLIFYQEYALIERELNSTESAINILTTATSSNDKPIMLITDEGTRASLCSLHRTLAEFHINIKENIELNKQRALKCLVTLAIGKTATDFVSQGSLNEATLKFKHVTLQLLQTEQPSLTAVHNFLPDFFSNWIVANGWFLYLTKGPIESGAFIENTLTAMDDKNLEKSWHKEVLFEFYVAMLFKHCLEYPESGIFKLLDDVLHRAVALYPNNLFLLAVIAKEQSLNCCLGQHWWKLNSLLMKTGRAIPTLFLILIANQKVYEIEESIKDTITGRPFAVDTSMKNRMLSLFRRVTSPTMCTRRCGLIWRLYLQFLHLYFHPTMCRNAYYAAVEECPWLKVLYIDAAIYIPAELSQIQDLLIEKQLRLHVTPEELDILRN